MSPYKNAVAAGVVITVIGMLLVLVHYRQISGRQGTIIIPAGNTYLGPPNTATPSTDNAPWHTVKGHVYPYTMSVPETVTLTTFPNDPYDMYALMGSDPASNVLIGVDDLSKNTARSQFINQPKSTYINQWWKQFSVLTGVKSIDPFTDSKGLKGYKVKFLNANGESPNLDIFFEVPAAPQYVIHLSNGQLDPAVFANIVDSVGWEKE
ncbi:MAG: hypothetical protein NT149_01630 [Candidatus Gottesmanbacteria bacterium]|nr:hypothetical protein [Candidatus Gottesmanbacteria bacterium]